MKKYFLKGKELLSKKLEEFDIEPVSIDYVAEQTPARLKQSLSVLQDKQIDLEDNHEYESYFKNYPNHHISHYLMDKVKTNDKYKTEAKSNSCGQLLPGKPDFFVPPFDDRLEEEALLFKNAIEEYDEGYDKNDQPLFCICVIHFHHKRGTEIEYKYPDSKKINQISDQIIHHAMPDSSHLRDQDCNFFNFESKCYGKKRMMFGVSYFKQIKVTEKMKKNNSQLTRSHVQKAIAVISALPLFEYLKIRLENTTQVFFEDFTNFEIIKQAYTNINHNLLQAWPQIQLPDLYMGCEPSKMLQTFGSTNLYQIWKALLYQKRVVVFAQTSSDASSFILSLLSLFPGLNTFGVCSKPISRYLQSLREYALPLRIFSTNNFLAISFHVQDFWQLSKFSKNAEDNFLLGTTNKLLKQSNQYGIQMLVNLEDGTVIKNKPRRPWQPLSKKQKNFILQLKEMADREGEQSTPKLNELIREYFHEFLKTALVQMIIGMAEYHEFIEKCENYQKCLKKQEKNQAKKNSTYEFMEDQDDGDPSGGQSDLLDYAPTFPNSTQNIILPELLLNKSFAYFRQFHNTNLPDIVNGRQTPSILINNYEYVYRKNKEDFIVYNWLDKKLEFGKGNPENCDCKEIKFKSDSRLGITRENQKEVVKSIYIGMLKNKKYSKHGFYVDQTEHYEGEFQDGLKSGYGKFSNGHQKYIGNFVNNLYEGEGQLIKQGEIYVGSFKQGLRHGYGNVQGSRNLTGYWEQDQFVSENGEIHTDLQKETKSQRKKSESEGSKR